jgi:chemotaxis-related protein WspD
MSQSLTRKPNESETCWNSIGVYGDHSCPELPTHLHCRNCPIYQNAGWRLLDERSPPGYLEEWTERLEQPQDANLNSGNPMVLFRISEEWLAVSVQPVSEITNLRAIHAIPHRSNSILLGIANVRGELPLCIAMHRLLSTGDQQSEQNLDRLTRWITQDNVDENDFAGRFLVVRLKNGLWALWVDEVHSVLRVATEKIMAVPSTLKRSTSSLLQGVYLHEGKSVGLIDEDKLNQQLLKVLP